MEQNNKSRLVPEQYTGKAIDTEDRLRLSDTKEAQQFFKVVKERLSDVNNWKQVAGTLSATFQLVDGEGNNLYRTVQKGDYFKIDIPGPDNKNGEGYDWVHVEEIEDRSTPDGEVFGIRVRPARPPQHEGEPTSHFYGPDSTSSFTVRREGAEIIAGIYDRNTKPNDESDSIVGKIRDKVVGFLGVAQFSKVQWKGLTEGLLKM